MGVCLVTAAVVLRVLAASRRPLHPDECLYASWALSIRSGDVWLATEPVDKPPLFPYLLAGWMGLFGTTPLALRLLGLTASLGTIVLVSSLSAALFGTGPALCTLAFIALCPVAVALDATAFTDPVATFIAVGGLVASAAGRTFLSGLALGLAGAAKPQLLSYLPGAALLLASARSSRSRWWAAFVAGPLLPVTAVVGWGAARGDALGFVHLAWQHFGGRDRPISISQWLSLLGWIGARDSAAWCVLAMSAIAAAFRPANQLRRRPIAAMSFVILLGHLLGNVLLRAPAWDRYVLALLPPVALLLGAGVAGLPGRLQALTPALAVFLAFRLWLPAFEAAHGVYPLGDTSRYDGIEQVVNYLRGQVPGRATILHRDLGWHIRYYMAGFPQDFRWEPRPEDMARAAARAHPCYVLLVVDNSSAQFVGELRAMGLALVPKLVTYHANGSPALVLYYVQGMGLAP